MYDLSLHEEIPRRLFARVIKLDVEEHAPRSLFDVFRENNCTPPPVEYHKFTKFKWIDDQNHLNLFLRFRT